MTWNENWVWKNKLESIYCVSCGCFTYQKEDYNVSQDLIFLNSQNSHKTTVSNLAETLCQGQNPYPQPHTQPNCMQLPMTSLCWNPLIMANILNILNSVMKKEKEKSSEPGWSQLSIKILLIEHWDLAVLFSQKPFNWSWCGNVFQNGNEHILLILKYTF